MNDLHLVGLSHHTAPLIVRERVALSGEAVKEALRSLRGQDGVSEAMLITTCNRVEALVVAESAEPARRFFLDRAPGAEGHLYAHRGVEAVRHLFRVAASLDSMVVGEQQILGQVKEAYGTASAVQAAGPSISRLCNRAFAAAKRVRSETEIGCGASSVSQVAVELVGKIFEDLAGRTVLLVGAGQMGALSARALTALGAPRVLVANRSLARAVELAASVGGHARGWDELPGLLAEADVVVVSTGAQSHVLTAEAVEAAMRGRRHRSLCLINLAVPRNVDPRCSGLSSVYAYDLDDLQRMVETTHEARAGEAQRGAAIVESEVEAFFAERQVRAALPVLAALRRQAETIAAAEAERTLSLLAGKLDERERRRVEAMAHAIVSKLLHLPTARLKRAAVAGDAALAAAAAELFGLEEGAPLAPARTSPEGESTEIRPGAVLPLTGKQA